MGAIEKITSKIPIGTFKLIKARCTRAKFPHAIQLNITFRCNQRCAYCEIYQDKRYEMTTQEIQRMIDEFAGLGTSRLSLTGGEPLLREDLAEVVGHARKRGMFVSVATNGSLVPDKIGDMTEVSNVNMTLDGLEATHDQQRGKGNFKKVLTALELVKKKKIPVYVNMVITKNNHTQVEDVLRIVKSLDIKILIQPVFYAEQSHAGSIEKYQNTKYEDSDMIETLDQLIRLKEKGDPSIMLSKRYYKKVRESIIHNTPIKCCYGGMLYCTISPDGRVGPCNLFARDMRLLNGNEVGFEKALMNMPDVGCEGCISSFIDFDDLYALKPDVIWNYYKHYLKLVGRQSASVG